MTAATATYLADLTLPKPGTVCSDETPPSPVTAANTVSSKLYSQLRSGAIDDHNRIDFAG